MTSDDLALAAGRYMDTVFRLALHTTKNRADAEDITQNVFLKLYQTPTVFHSEEHRKRWLLRVTVNECRSLFRRAGRRDCSLEGIPEPGDDARDIQARELLESVLSLPEKYRTVIYLHYYEGYRTEEIAEILALSPTAVRSRLMRARRMLREDWKEEDYA